MRRLIIRWLALLLFVMAIGVTCVLLGQWQLARLEERRVTNESIQSREDAVPVSASEVFGGPITEAEEWQRVEITGTYDGANQIVVRLRTLDRQPGVEVVTPLRTADGLTVLVDRGFMPTDRNRPTPTTGPAPPAGEVTVTGFVRVDERGGDQATVPVDGQTRLVNAPKIATVLPYPVADGWISLQSSTPAETELVPLSLPELSDGPHFWYAVQWFMFASIGLAGLIVFVRGDLRERRAERGTPQKAPKQKRAKMPSPDPYRPRETEPGSSTREPSGTAEHVDR